MTQTNSFATQTAMTINRVFGTMGLTLGLLLGVLGILQPAAAQPIALGDAALLTPIAVGDNLELATSEGFTKVGFKGHRGLRRRHFKGGHGFRGQRFGRHGFRGQRFGRHSFRGQRFGRHGFRGQRFGGHGYVYWGRYYDRYERDNDYRYKRRRRADYAPTSNVSPSQSPDYRPPTFKWIHVGALDGDTPSLGEGAPSEQGEALTNCLSVRTQITVDGVPMDAFGKVCMRADGIWRLIPTEQAR